jgi:hypothetical protein
VPLDQPRGPRGVPGGQRVSDGVVDRAVLLVPGGRGVVQHRQPLGPLLPETGAEQVGEQVVVAPPAAYLVERHQEQVGALDLFQQLLAVAAVGDRVAQRPGQPLED